MMDNVTNWLGFRFLLFISVLLPSSGCKNQKNTKKISLEIVESEINSLVSKITIQQNIRQMSATKSDQPFETIQLFTFYLKHLTFNRAKSRHTNSSSISYLSATSCIEQQIPEYSNRTLLKHQILC